MDQESYRKLISGQKGGPAAVFVRLFLAAASVVYAAVVGIRNRLYSKGLFKIRRADATVISVGNITAGGTGKTPLVIWICRFLQNKNIPCAILTRGYKTHTQARGTRIDEPAILAEGCPEAAVIVNPDRVAGACEAVNRFGAKVLIMDDGFQHRRLARQLDIVTIDATLPFGYGRLLPAGLLREPTAELRRADAAVITRCDQAGETELDEIEQKLRRANPKLVIARSVHWSACVKRTDAREMPVEELRGKKIFAFCGIGNPQAFFRAVTEAGAEVVGSKIYNDHHNYTERCLADMSEEAGHLNTDLILTTQKDWAKINLIYESVIEDSKWAVSLAYLVIELRFAAGEDKLKRLIESTPAGKISGKSNNQLLPEVTD